MAVTVVDASPSRGSLRRAGAAGVGFAAALTAFGALAYALAPEGSPAVLLVVLAVPTIMFAGEDSLALGLAPAVLPWIPLGVLLWWWAGRWAARLAARGRTGLTPKSWAVTFAGVAFVVLTAQTLVLMALLFAVMG
jgi:hypothetical protein